MQRSRVVSDTASTNTESRTKFPSDSEFDLCADVVVLPGPLVPTRARIGEHIWAKSFAYLVRNLKSQDVPSEAMIY